MSDPFSGTGWRTVTDTIGDTVVVPTVGATDSAATLRLMEELRIGEMDGDEAYQFADIRAVIAAVAGGVLRNVPGRSPSPPSVRTCCLVRSKTRTSRARVSST